MNVPRVTAHCLVKNEQRWVWFALMSVLDFVDEILVWDDSSTDATAKVVAQITSPKINYRRIRIGSGHITVVRFYVAARRCIAFAYLFQTRFQLLVGLAQLVLQVPRVNDRIIGSIGINQTGINKYFAAVYETGFHTLQDDALEELLENFYAPPLPGLG